MGAGGAGHGRPPGRSGWAPQPHEGARLFAAGHTRQAETRNVTALLGLSTGRTRAMLREDAVPLEVFHERDLVGYGQSTSHPHRPRRLALGIGLMVLVYHSNNNFANDQDSPTGEARHTKPSFPGMREAQLRQARNGILSSTHRPDERRRAKVPPPRPSRDNQFFRSMDPSAYALSHRGQKGSNKQLRPLIMSTPYRRPAQPRASLPALRRGLRRQRQSPRFSRQDIRPPQESTERWTPPYPRK